MPPKLLFIRYRISGHDQWVKKWSGEDGACVLLLAVNTSWPGNCKKMVKGKLWKKMLGMVKIWWWHFASTQCCKQSSPFPIIIMIIAIIIIIVVVVVRPQLRCEKIEEDQRKQARKPSLLSGHSQNYEAAPTTIFYSLSNFWKPIKTVSKFGIVTHFSPKLFAKYGGFFLSPKILHIKQICSSKPLNMKYIILVLYIFWWYIFERENVK